MATEALGHDVLSFVDARKRNNLAGVEFTKTTKLVKTNNLTKRNVFLFI